MAQHRSVSQLLKYSNCSEQYRLEYVDKVDNTFRPAAWLAQGSAFHETVQLWEESGRSPAFDIGRTFVVIYNREIESFKQRQPDLKKWLHGLKTSTQDDIDNRRDLGIKQLQNYVDFAESDNFIIKDIDDYTLAVEVPFVVTLGSIELKGAIDQILLLPDGVEVRDLKTGNRESANLQLAIYVLVVEKLFGWPVQKASYYYAKDSKLVTLSRNQLDRYSEEYLTELFNALDTGIRNQVFIPNPGSGCILCPVKDNCRELGSSPRPLGPKPPVYR
jgi:putative RecB family exonuclease